MIRKIVITGDGSSTIHLPEWNEQYHSKHGAIQEAYHVFIKHGLHHFCIGENEKEKTKSSEISILEIGFGTALNAYITLLESEKFNLNINYVGVEGYPVSMEEIEQLNYAKELNAEDNRTLFKKIHKSPWDESYMVTPKFSLIKQQKFFSEIKDVALYNVIYFDAFGARVQPELWTEAIFKNMFKALKPGGMLVTYSAKGSVRRAMQSVGFKVERLEGPPGKREMLRASKP
ncbi:tRNA (5-methylaminomethyl-2-thiouridine)(34)-methyltransferase MnmD [Changchengzhania lutea]|uniref:tRNA (5-methylaminomethyl-2-thiouridine)(34)-methyltransferase MnmD n=1 Tax=Changchengzhania lutea TaxID=2049305 RepID=UPI00115DC021|nr:tRNA (5-methylaminomethyl-2-thiouridine)(34)-methyltransferase MnmD [Changchengzhania lutea]